MDRHQHAEQTEIRRAEMGIEPMPFFIEYRAGEKCETFSITCRSYEYAVSAFRREHPLCEPRAVYY